MIADSGIFRHSNQVLLHGVLWDSARTLIKMQVGLEMLIAYL